MSASTAPRGAISRRIFLEALGQAAGCGTTYAAMCSLGLLAVPGAASALPQGLGRVGQGLRVGIVGAGLAGLVTAHELGKLGYACTILEASGRPGGRCLTLRGGDQVLEYGGVQQVPWLREEHLYANMGPARIPYHHKTLLGYCRSFGVPLEVFVNENRAAFVHDTKAFGGKPLQNRHVVHATRGAIAELLAKAVNRQALDDVLSPDDKERLLAMLKNYGELGRGHVYQGASRAGYSVTPGAGLVEGVLHERAPLQDLLKAEFTQANLSFTEEWNQAATMLQPVGGMDRIVQAFVRQVGDRITYRAPVEAVRKAGEGARIVYRHEGVQRVLEVDHAVVTLPFPALQKIETDFSAAHKAAMKSCHYTQAAKIAFQAGRRFWEEDQQIYGGISWTDTDIGQMWYPSGGLMQDKGILIGAYIRNDAVGTRYAAMGFAERLEAALACGELIHPGYRREVQHGVSVCWPRVPHADGGWAVWSAEARKTHYPVLTRPDGPLHLAGDQVSYLPGWQEGSILSGHAVVADIALHTAAQRPA